jgi:hypothetical protein
MHTRLKIQNITKLIAKFHSSQKLKKKHIQIKLIIIKIIKMKIHMRIDQNEC